MQTLTAVFLALMVSLVVQRAKAHEALDYECYPPGSSKSEPIQAIYMAGLFDADGVDSQGFVSLEIANREKLKKLAKELGIKIAIPLGIKSPRYGYREWNGMSLAEIEKRARRACGGAHLAEHRILIGFSNGARRLAEMGNSHESCVELAGYDKVVVMGAQGYGGDQEHKCGGKKFAERSEHTFPRSYVEQRLKNLDYRLAPSERVIEPAQNLDQWESK